MRNERQSHFLLRQLEPRVPRSVQRIWNNGAAQSVFGAENHSQCSSTGLQHYFTGLCIHTGEGLHLKDVLNSPVAEQGVLDSTEILNPPVLHESTAMTCQKHPRFSFSHKNWHTYMYLLCKVREAATQLADL